MAGFAFPYNGKMFKFFARICNTLATLYALLSPLAVIHWLFKVYTLPLFFQGVMQFGDNLFQPGNMMLEHFYHFPILHFYGHSLSLTEAIQAILLTVLFFVFNFASQILLTLDKKLLAAKESHNHHILERNMREKEKIEVVKVVQQHIPVVFVSFPFEQSGVHREFFKVPGNGTLVQHGPDFLYIQFAKLENALGYSQDAANKCLAFNQTLRPMDPCYPFRLSLHTIESGQENLAWGLEKCRNLNRFTGENQVYLTLQAKQLYDVSNLNGKFRCQSQGIYILAPDQNEEVFQLILPIAQIR